MPTYDMTVQFTVQGDDAEDARENLSFELSTNLGQGISYEIKDYVVPVGQENNDAN